MPGLPFQGHIERVTLLPTHLPLSTVLGCAVGGRQSSEGWSLVQGEGQVNTWMDAGQCDAYSPECLGEQERLQWWKLL